MANKAINQTPNITRFCAYAARIFAQNSSTFGAGYSGVNTHMKYITLILFFLVGCSSQGPTKYFPNGLLSERVDLDMFVQSWYGKHLASMREPSLIDTTENHYRFTWLPTFSPPMVFRISETNSEYVLYVKRTNGAGGYDPGKIIDNVKISLSRKDAQKIIQKLETDCQFWEQPTRLDTFGSDGSQWIFEASKNQRYHVVDRWSPNEGCLFEVGTELMTLSKIEINEIY